MERISLRDICHLCWFLIVNHWASTFKTNLKTNENLLKFLSSQPSPTSQSAHSLIPSNPPPLSFSPHHHLQPSLWTKKDLPLSHNYDLLHFPISVPIISKWNQKSKILKLELYFTIGKRKTKQSFMEIRIQKLKRSCSKVFLRIKVSWQAELKDG